MEGYERGIVPGGLWVVILCLVVVFACIFAPLVIYGIEDSRANRAQAKASAENAQAAAAAAQAQAQVDEVRAVEEGKTQRLAEDHEFDLALREQQNREFQERLILLVTVIQGMDEDKFDRLMDRLEGKPDRTPLWWSGVAACAAMLVFLLILMAVSLWMGRRGRKL